jgi:DNA-binding NarL/FixJ family response regulator
MDSSSKQIMEMLRQLDAKLDKLMEIKRQRLARDKFPDLTTKQHAALQMLLAGCSNQAIAERMGIALSTAKLHVRAIMAKLGVTTRAQVVIKAKDWFDETPADEYRISSGGLPKDWHRRYRKPDPYAHLYYYEEE